MLSGYEIVAKGATKIEATLPELGLKDNFPNRTWLEDKQIQAAIESRKQLIEIPRIEKSGMLSYAEWREDQMMAEVTQKVGSYWQYLGHNVGKKLFLRPEEALFLLEINSLCLKHNDVIVSLQQAYSLLLRDRMTLLQYKVYASLSRLGFRVYRHQISESSIDKQTINLNPGQKENQMYDKNKHDRSSELCENSSKNLLQCDIKMQEKNSTVADGSMDMIETLHSKNKPNVTVEISPTCNTGSQSSSNNYPSCSQIKQGNICIKKKLQNFKNRQLIPCNSEILHKYFEKLPELLGKGMITVKAPDKKLLPQTVVVNNSTYKLNLQNIQNKSIRPASTGASIYSANEEINGNHIRRLRNISNRTESNWIPPTGNVRFVNQNIYFRPFHHWRPPQPFNYFNINMHPFQRAFFPGWVFTPNLNFFPRPQPEFWRPNFNNSFRNIYSSHNRKMMRKTVQKEHLDGILKLAAQLKQLILNGNTQEENIYSLQKLIQTYNSKYKTKLRLNERFDVVVDETIIDTIELDDDEGPSSKRRRTTDPAFEDNLNSLKLFAQRLKELECNDKASGRHRRAFSKLLKTFNESYTEDYYLNEEHEVVYRNQVDLDTSESSDLDCIIDTPNIHGKKLKNPFNIMKRFSENQNVEQVDETNGSNNKIVTNKYSPMLVKIFTKDWLPREDDFGRAEVIGKDADLSEVIDVKKEEFLYDFIKIQKHRYDNWLDLKKSFYNSIQAAISEFQTSIPARDSMEINSIVKLNDCVDMVSVLKKLNIIKTNNEIRDNCNLEVDFDVYERDIQNFRKTNRPTPHFRLICLDESSDVPRSDEIAALHNKYNDKVTIVFAIVNVDSISYIQMNPTDLPMYISS